MYKIITLSIVGLFLSAGVAFACVPQVTIPEPSIEISPSIEPSTEPSIEVTVDPTATPEASVVSNVGDGKGDGRSDGLSSCPDCTKAPVFPKAPPKTGRGL
jgi:hypothetical protein